MSASNGVVGAYPGNWVVLKFVCGIVAVGLMVLVVLYQVYLVVTQDVVDAFPSVVSSFQLFLFLFVFVFSLVLSLNFKNGEATGV